MKKLLLLLVVILTALGMYACQTSEKQTDPIVELETYDYYLLIVVSRQRKSQDTFVYVLKDTSTPETTDTITYESDKLWSVGEFVIAIELDEEGNVYFTDLNTTKDMKNEFEKLNEQIEMMELYYELKLDYYEELYGFDLDDTPEDFVKFLYDNYRELYDYLVEVDNDK